MAVHTNIDDGADIYQAAGGPENPRCLWFDGVCTETPTKYITFPTDAASVGQAKTYCTRHYVLTLARHLEVHDPTCEHSGINAHIGDHGDFA